MHKLKNNMDMYMLNNFIFYSSVIDIIQKEVNAICDDYWGNDECKPQFLISIGNEYINIECLENDRRLQHDSIIMTIIHMGSSFSISIFPQKDSFYGYGSLFDLMKEMYNRTM